MEHKYSYLDSDRAADKAAADAKLEVKDSDIRRLEAVLRYKDGVIDQRNIMLDRANKEIEKLRMQLVACGVAAVCNTEQSQKEHGIGKDNPAWSDSYAQVVQIVNKEMEYRGKVERLKRQRDEAVSISSVVGNEKDAYIRVIEDLRADLAALEAEVERMKKITSVDYLHSVFSRSIQVSKYDGGFGGEFPELDYYIHELQKRALGEHIDEIERLKREQDVTISVNDVLTHQRDAYIRVIEDLRADLAALEAEVERLKARFTRPIVCICGSTRFKQTWINENARLTGEGNIVLAVGLWGHHERVFPSEEVKAALDDLHKRKIDLCDWVWVLDVGGYIGSSTKSEIAYADGLGRPIRYLSKEFPDYVEPMDPKDADLAAKNKEIERLKGENKKLVEQIYVMKSLVENANEKAQQNWMDGIKLVSEKNDIIEQQKADIAALVTALDEKTNCNWCRDGLQYYFEKHSGVARSMTCGVCSGTLRDYSLMSPASRAIAEKWLEKK